MADDPFEKFKSAIASAKAPPPPPPIPTPEQARAHSEKLYADLIAAIPQFDTLAKAQDPNFSVAWRWTQGQADRGFAPITKAIIAARKGTNARALEMPVQMQSDGLWAEDPAFNEASGNSGGRWTPDRNAELISVLGQRLSTYFNTGS